MYFAWFLRKVSHRCCLPSSGIGFSIYFLTVFSQTLNPSFASSPWILWDVQVWFSLCIFRTSFISSQSIVGLPTLRDFHFQYSLKPFRCQPMTVWGLTIISADFQWTHVLDNQTQKRRSIFLILGAFMLRCWIANCCRRARFSRIKFRLLLSRAVNKLTISVQNVFKVAYSHEFL